MPSAWKDGDEQTRQVEWLRLSLCNKTQLKLVVYIAAASLRARARYVAKSFPEDHISLYKRNSRIVK